RSTNAYGNKREGERQGPRAEGQKGRGQDAQGHVGIQRGRAEIVERAEGHEPQAGRGNCAQRGAAGEEMIITLESVLLLLALIAFVLGAVGIPARVNLLAIGLAVLTLALLLRGHVRGRSAPRR